MAYKLGMSLTAYRDFEKGGTSILNGNLLKMATFLETPTEELVLGYHPSQEGGADLKKIQKEHSDKIEALSGRISYLEDLVKAKDDIIDSKRDIIASKDEIISLLKRKLADKEEPR